MVRRRSLLTYNVRISFLIKSVVASPGDTVEQSRKLLDEKKKHAVQGCKLRVVYILPPNRHSFNSERSGEGTSLHGSTVQQRGSSDIEQQTGWNVGDLFMKSLTVIFLCLIVWYLLPVIWSLTLMGSVFVIKMGKRLVSDSVEDWIGKTILYLCIHFFTTLFRRNKSRPDHDSRAG